VNRNETKSVHRSESVCDEESEMNDEGSDEEMWMKRDDERDAKESEEIRWWMHHRMWMHLNSECKSDEMWENEMFS
jgi:hypothetical protein